MNASITTIHELWNKGKLVGQKAPLRLKDIWPFVFGYSLLGSHKT